MWHNAFLGNRKEVRDVECVKRSSTTATDENIICERTLKLGPSFEYLFSGTYIKHSKKYRSRDCGKQFANIIQCGFHRWLLHALLKSLPKAVFTIGNVFTVDLPSFHTFFVLYYSLHWRRKRVSQKSLWLLTKWYETTKRLRVLKLTSTSITPNRSERFTIKSLILLFGKTLCDTFLYVKLVLHR